MAKFSLKKTASIIVRLAIVAAGLTYVATQLTWTDSIEVPAGTVVDGEPAAESVTLPVVSKSDAAITAATESGQSVVVERSAITGDPGAPRYLPGLVSTIRTAEVVWLVAGFVIILPMYPIQAFRWWLLLRALSVEAGYWRVFRLHMAGCFFNTFMPGLTGGDLMKAFYVVREGRQRTAAVLSIIVDRAVGLGSLVVLGSIAAAITVMIMRNADDPRLPLVWSLSWKVWAILVLLGVGAVTFYVGTLFVEPLKKLVGVRQVLARLSPDSVIRRVVKATISFRHRIGTLVAATSVSLPVHFLAVLSAAAGGWAVGMETELGVLLMAIPLVILIGALPLSFMGLGVMEPVGIALLAGSDFGATANQVVTMLILLRVYQILWSLSGGLFVVKGNLKLHHEQEMEQAMRDAETESNE